mgnify:CR=1 FL=1
MTLLTEDEAKSKVCPHLQADLFVEPCNDGIVHRVVQFPTCAASYCMMWRKHDQIGIGPNGEKRERDNDGRTRWVDRGYCGLAGKP